MLARISDNCKMVDRWSYPEKEEVLFEGAWEPYVRDYDEHGIVLCPVFDFALIFRAGLFLLLPCGDIQAGIIILRIEHGRHQLKDVRAHEPAGCHP